MNFIQNLFEDIVNQNVSSSSKLLLHAAFIGAMITEIFFFFAVNEGAYHFIILFLLTCGSYGAICWVFYQLANNQELKDQMERTKISNQETEETKKTESEQQETKEKSD